MSYASISSFVCGVALAKDVELNSAQVSNAIRRDFRARMAYLLLLLRCFGGSRGPRGGQRPKARFLRQLFMAPLVSERFFRIGRTTGPESSCHGAQSWQDAMFNRIS